RFDDVEVVATARDNEAVGPFVDRDAQVDEGDALGREAGQGDLQRPELSLAERGGLSGEAARRQTAGPWETAGPGARSGRAHEELLQRGRELTGIGFLQREDADLGPRR